MNAGKMFMQDIEPYLARSGSQLQRRISLLHFTRSTEIAI